VPTEIGPKHPIPEVTRGFGPVDAAVPLPFRRAACQAGTPRQE